MISNEEIDAILKGIWGGEINTLNLPESVYFENKNKLNEGVISGFGSGLTDIKKESAKFKTLKSLIDNVDSFSAAKTFQQVNDMQFLKFDENGFIVSFNDFKKDAGEVFETYNKTWLETEFNTSISQSQSAAQWTEIQADKNDLPLLKYQTVHDKRVRHEHETWDNIIRSVDDPFWNSHMPPNGYNCRCQVIQLSEGSVSNLKGVPNNSAFLFAENAGKTKLVFKDKGKDKHPYFEAPKKLIDKNFGLPTTKLPTKNEFKKDR